MIAGTVKALGGGLLVVADAVALAAAAQTGMPMLGSWGEAGVFIAGLSLGAAGVAWTLRTIRDLRGGGSGGTDSEVAAERRTATAVRQVLDEMAKTRHDLREQTHQLEMQVGDFEKEIGKEFREIERRIHDGGRHP